MAVTFFPDECRRAPDVVVEVVQFQLIEFGGIDGQVPAESEVPIFSVIRETFPFGEDVPVGRFLRLQHAEPCAE